MSSIAKKMISYLSFRRQTLDNGEKPGRNLRLMHGINRISIVMFLFALVVILIRAIR